MSSNINKIYNKAMDYYQRGEIDKAIDKCEEGISINLKSSNLLNLKGLLLYLKGDLNGAVAVWNINRDYNNNEISKVYIKDSKKDEDKLRIYEWAEQDIKELKIEDALVKLSKCAESDFNSINVNIAFAVCYLRKGDYILAREYNEKALKINIRDKRAISVKAQINEFSENPSDKFKSNILKTVISFVTLIVVLTGGYIFLDKRNVQDKLAGKEIQQEEVKQEIAKVVDKEQENDTNKGYIEKQQQESESVKELLTDEDVKEMYMEGSNYFKDKDYSKAIDVLNKAYINSEKMYLKDDILFFLASSYDKNNLKNEAIKYYEEYASKYTNENYIQEVYYNLALNYMDKDINKSKEYAKVIKDKYSDSMYYNSKIKEIISN